MDTLLDHPAIRNAERTGYPDNRRDEEPVCPICGARCEDIYKDREGEIVGCDECLKRCNAWEVM